MVSLVINSPGYGLTTPRECGGNLPARADSDELDMGRADIQAVGRRSGIGAEYEAGKARIEDGAGGAPAEEQTCVRGRGTRLLKIGESRTRMRGREGNFEWEPLSKDLNSMRNRTYLLSPHTSWN